MEELIGATQAQSLANGLGGTWKVTADGMSLRADYVLRDFASAVELIARVAALAEQADHHPDLHLTSYRKLAIELSTHSAGGLTKKDFALAAKIEALPKALKGA